MKNYDYSKEYSGADRKETSNTKTHSLKETAEKFIYSKHMLVGIAMASFLEAILVPIPLETILIPLMQARRKDIFIISSVALIACIMAAALGYAIGYFVFDAVGTQLVSWVSTPEQFDKVSQKMQEQGFWFVISVGIVPIPFQIAMLAAGATKYSFWLFLLATTLSRSLRYYGLALLVLFAGNKAEALFKRHRVAVSVVLVLIVTVVWGYSIWG